MNKKVTDFKCRHLDAASYYYYCASGCVVECQICNREVAGLNLGLRTKVYSAFHPSGVGK